MNSSERQKHNPHERWCTRFALRLCGDVRVHHVFRQYLVVDATMFMSEPVTLWANLAPYLIGREVLIEHFSNSVTGAHFASCQEKISHASKIFESTPRKNRGEQRAPCMVILAHRQPDRLLSMPGMFEATDTRGIWVRRPLEMGAIFLIVTTRLPNESRYDWLRLTTRIPVTSEAFRVADALMKETNLDTLTEQQLQEEVMELIIDGKTPIDLKNELKELQRSFAAEKRAAEEEKKAAEEEKKAAEEEKKAAEEEKKAAEARVSLLEREVQDLKNLLAELRQNT